MKYILNHKGKSEPEVWGVVPKNYDEKYYVILYGTDSILYYQDRAVEK